MLILVSGEGPTDIGKASGNYDLYAPGSWDPGPMAYFINSIIYNTLNFEPLDSMSMWFIPEVSLNSISRTLKPMTLGQNKEFRKAARVLLASAVKLSQETNCEVLPILFRDADGSRSQRSLGRWKEKHDSIDFCMDRKQEVMHVCPMLPNPKSEVWLLCALKNNYQSCNQLEDISGNDNSQNSAKSILRECLGTEATQECLVELMKESVIRPEAINMPSFNAWKDDLSSMAMTNVKDRELSDQALRNLREIAASVRIGGM